ncbi:hypothetical protein SLS55_003746 [Diplodia seriata]|uniref:Prostacyclin synthase n=1 Tax=Diplodia seriata TaxID=420778 RepID=A0ABR3CNS5_9PEZI
MGPTTSKRKGVDIATLPILGGKMYAIWDISMIQSGLKAKTMSFDAIMMQHAQGLLGLSDKSLGLARDGMLTDLMNVTKPILAGEPLARINATVLNHAAETLDAIRRQPEAYEIPDLYDWVQTTATLATTEALYGAANPLAHDKSLIDDVWHFEAGLRRLALGILPSIIAPRANAARDRLVSALASIFDDDDAVPLPELTQRRLAVIRRHGITSAREAARIELALLHGATVNTVPTLFWTLAHVFARPALVAAIRAEALPFVTMVENDESNEKEAHFPVRGLDTNCSLLLSAYREATRLANRAMSTRHVTADTVLADARGNQQYVLRAGATVAMPATAHVSPRVWGEDAAAFDPARFLGWDKRDGHINNSKERRAAYMPFGGGKHLCPGRNLAKAEVLGVVAALAVAFDVEAAAGGPIEVPEVEPARLGQGVGKPVRGRDGRGVAARIRVREGWEGVRWRFVL